MTGATVSFRADESTVEAIEWLLENTDGSDRSEVIRRAILDEARQLQNDRIRAQAEAIAADEDDRAEMRAVRADLDAIRAW